jgi:hypothetical protein
LAIHLDEKWVKDPIEKSIINGEIDALSNSYSETLDSVACPMFWG